MLLRHFALIFQACASSASSDFGCVRHFGYAENFVSRNDLFAYFVDLVANSQYAFY
ncbi:hypothetical protein RA210_U330010 [Rubrivivax sp. A210]|nr:hypothetical protein RA210_U330010 [Rubrivivax sp. A210]